MGLCKKCDKIFVKQTRHCTICDECWLARFSKRKKAKKEVLVNGTNKVSELKLAS